MHEFETFAYLDVQKTGSTYISHLLKHFCSENMVSLRKHGRVGSNYDPSKFYFISVRNPLDQYISLYSHGSGGAGALFSRLGKRGYGHLYDSTWSGFSKWLTFVLKPSHAKFLDKEYASDEAGDLHRLIGFQTYRYLELAMREPIEALSKCKTKEDVRSAYRENNIVNFTIRHESFDADIKQLLSTQLRGSMSDIDAALEYHSQGTRRNVSDRVDQFEDDANLRPRIRRLLQEREWFLYELFGYSTTQESIG